MTAASDVGPIIVAIGLAGLAVMFCSLLLLAVAILYDIRLQRRRDEARRERIAADAWARDWNERLEA